ncbi:NUDIX domain-containing protein [Belliella kenyensis]|uniref:NUDIX domain-containing protein n=1 Tax=Belliella kenyensis TaxID=1472724 RepID=A0ABV8EGZ2_9BACT|nr:NUDIX domain-containing protein [Belliella kenyensis]MCH7400891.1 NUDIX domain-containing protein [Belliella kenyensis]MDN3603891.1 NUDIX domain-containing protein [Belliella kenyensis]
MEKLEQTIKEKFGNRLRVRVNGVLIVENKILLIKHKMGENRFFWNVPGGGMKFGSSAEDNLKREFLEETGLDIEVKDFLCTFEYLEKPLHAIELYFEVNIKSGILKMGIDPELSEEMQLITEICFVDMNNLALIKKSEKHRLFWGINSLNDVRKLKGYFNFENNYLK